jgi:hypothetical protein
MNRQAITIKHGGNFNLRVSSLRCLLALLAVGMTISSISAGAEDASAGFLFDHFKLTLEDGCRTEAAGPFYYSQHTDSENVWAVPPFFSCDRNPSVESHEDDFFYPLLTHIRYGQEHRWQFGQLISTSTGGEPGGADVKRFTLFPIYFQQRAPDTNLNYTAVVPFYGRLKNRLFHDEIYFILFPVFGETRKRDIVTDNYFYPLVHVRHGDGLDGWQVWPFVGREHKDVTTQTNGFGDTTLIAGHDRAFYLWPFYLKQNNGIGTDNPEKFRASIPFFAISRSPQRDSTAVLWPIFASIDDRAKKYHEWQGPWPLVIFAHGEGKTTSRVFPLFSRSRNSIKESDSYLGLLYTFHRTQAEPLDQQRTRVLVYLYSRLTDKNTETGAERTRLDMWPFFTWHHDFNGNERLQILAPLEPAVPDNRGIERNWSPLWSLWRAEENPKSGASSRSLLWNLYRRETAPGHKKVSLLFGLFQYQSNKETERTRLFYFTVSQTPPPKK